MHEFNRLEDAKRVVKAARKSYRAAPDNPQRVVHADLGGERVKVTCWQQPGKANFGLEPGWRFTGSWPELKAWWERDRSGEEGRRTCPPPRAKDDGLWEVNLRYRLAGRKEFDFHLTMSEPGREQPETASAPRAYAAAIPNNSASSATVRALST